MAAQEQQIDIDKIEHMFYIEYTEHMFAKVKHIFYFYIRDGMTFP